MHNEERAVHVSPTTSDNQGHIAPETLRLTDRIAPATAASQTAWDANASGCDAEQGEGCGSFSSSHVPATECTGFSVSDGETPRPSHLAEHANDMHPTEVPLDEVPFDLLDLPDTSSGGVGAGSRSERARNAEADDLDPELVHMVAVNQRILQGYLCERFSPELQPNVLRTRSAVELRRACVEAVGQVENACPSLDPRDRIVFLSSKQAAARVTYLLQSFVSSRLQKILESPSIFWRMQQEKEWRSRRRGLDPSASEATASPRTETPEHLNSVEAVAFDVLERAFAQEVEKLWDAYGIVESYAPSLFRTVHCRAMPDGPSVAAAQFSAEELEETSGHTGLLFGSTTRKRLLEALGDASKDCAEAMAMTPSVMSSTHRTSDGQASQASQVQAASVTSFPHSQGATRLHINNSSGQGTGSSAPFADSGSQERCLAPGAVLTADYNLVKYLVQEGSLSLIG